MQLYSDLIHCGNYDHKYPELLIHKDRLGDGEERIGNGSITTSFLSYYQSFAPQNKDVRLPWKPVNTGILCAIQTLSDLYRLYV